MSPSKSNFTLRQRVLLFLIGWIGYLAVRLIGPTLRWTKENEEGGATSERQHPVVWAFWHRCVFPASYVARELSISVMTSASFDGEYIARIIERLGFLAVRGSSSQGGMRALQEMRELAEQGHSAAFTVDGPRGPKYVAKLGPVLLAGLTGFPISPFHIALDRAWVMKSWDGFMIPKPFSRARLFFGRLIYVPPGLSGEQLQPHQQELQAALDRVRITAEQRMMAMSGRNA